MTAVDTRPTAEVPPTPKTSHGPERRAHERSRALARFVRRALLGAFVLAAAAGTALALRPRAVSVDLATAARGPLVVAIEETGTTRVKDRYVVSAPVTGMVSRLILEPGDAVKEGDTLVEVAPATAPLLDERSRSEAEARLGAAVSALGQARAQQARATAALELSKRDLERSKKLVESGALAREPLEQAEFLDRMRGEELASTVFAGKVAAEEVRMARAALGSGGAPVRGRHVDVIAPVSGSVLRVHQKSAGVVQAGTPLLEVGDDSALEVVVDLLTTDAVHVAPGTPVVLQGWGGDTPIAGRVRHVERSGFTRPSALGVDEQRVNVLIVFTEAREKWAALGDGYRVEARLVLWQSSDVLKVPQGAVFRHGDSWAVYRVERGTSRLTAVTIGHRGEAEVEILSGLEAGAAVAVHPGDRVKDGARVESR